MTIRLDVVVGQPDLLMHSDVVVSLCICPYGMIYVGTVNSGVNCEN